MNTDYKKRIIRQRFTRDFFLFDILYFTPSATLIFNTADKSFSLSPELLYTGITNLELRLKAAFISGEWLSEYGEKQNDYRLEARARYYF